MSDYCRYCGGSGKIYNHQCTVPESPCYQCGGTGIAQQDFSCPLCSGKDKSIKELEAEAAQMSGNNTAFKMANQQHADRITELEAKLNKDSQTFEIQCLREVDKKYTTLITELREMAIDWKYQKICNPSESGKVRNRWLDRCANELTALLDKQEQSDE